MGGTMCHGSTRFPTRHTVRTRSGCAGVHFELAPQLVHVSVERTALHALCGQLDRLAERESIDQTEAHKHCPGVFIMPNGVFAIGGPRTRVSRYRNAVTETGVLIRGFDTGVAPGRDSECHDVNCTMSKSWFPRFSTPFL